MSGNSVSAETVEKAYAILRREADLDGLVTVSEKDLAEILDLSKTSASTAIDYLERDGRLVYAGRSEGSIHRPIKAYFIPEDQ